VRPRLRKGALTAHVAASVGWLGAVVAFLVLAIAALVDGGSPTARAAYVAMEPIAWLVLLPLSVASLTTGVVQSVATPWGLFRHYWVIFKLGINVFATAVLLMYMATLDELARLAADTRTEIPAGEPWSPVLHAAAACVLLLVATTLAVYKPHGLTPWGRKKQLGRREAETKRSVAPRR
jgi:hypothetical protein